MTPREQAHQDILTAYRRWRTTMATPIEILYKILFGYATILADDNAQGDESDPGWVMRYGITQEYIASMYHRTNYWFTPHPIGKRNVVQEHMWKALQMTGTGWPMQ